MRRGTTAAVLLAAAVLFGGGATYVLRHSTVKPLPEISWDALSNAQPPAPGQTMDQEFDGSLLSLNGRNVALNGFMTPFNLGDGSTVSSFLLTGTPGTCPFCMGAGPTDFVIIAANPPVPIDISDEIKLKGRFKLMQNDDTGFYYRLDDATIAP